MSKEMPPGSIEYDSVLAGEILERYCGLVRFFGEHLPRRRNAG
jgi:hypothetical protein